jgi:hypothetical protein
MDETSVTQSILNMFEGVETASAQGYTFFFYGPDRRLPLATQDNEYDRGSHLDRPSVFRLDIGSTGRRTDHYLARNRRALARTVLLILAMTLPLWTN